MAEEAAVNPGTREALVRAALVVASAAGVIGRYCDRVEHVETADPSAVRTAGTDLRAVAVELAQALDGTSAVELYANRLATIERANVLASRDGFDGAAAVRAGRTWRDLQLAQVEHDRIYHPDVLGLSRADQLRHYAFHVAKLAGALSDTARGKASLDDVIGRRLPDLLLFGIKLATVTGETLPDAALDRPPPP